MKREAGAVLAIVAISMLALLGMLVLVVDLGRSVALRRLAVTAADAGALAAAQACAEGADPAAAAAILVTANVETGTATEVLHDLCGGPTGRVTVHVEVPVEYVFAPIFGVADGIVRASATAEWFPAAPCDSSEPLVTALEVVAPGPCSVRLVE